MAVVVAGVVTGCDAPVTRSKAREAGKPAAERNVIRWRTPTNEVRYLGITCYEDGEELRVRFYELKDKTGWDVEEELPTPVLDEAKGVYILPLVNLPFMTAADFAEHNAMHMKAAIDPSAEKIVAEFHSAGHQVGKYEFHRYRVKKSAAPVVAAAP